MAIFNFKAETKKAKHVAGTQAASDQLIYTTMEAATIAKLVEMGRTDAQIAEYMADNRADERSYNRREAAYNRKPGAKK